jgi:Kef-type K+ transport system membrane component KefB/nucleotide-binding universal stress UspA family protein
MKEFFHNPIALLLLQALIIIPLARLLGALFSKINQPLVIGEIIAGLLLGPSFLGWVAPEVYHFLFPETSLHGLNLLSQIGLIFFMFLVGLEFNPMLLRGRSQTALATSHASIVFPFLLGTLLALYFYPKLSDASVRFTPFALFLGASMSVTAFPVLARILTERNLIRSKMGTLALTCGAVDDITAWIILAFVISVVRATGSLEIFQILFWTVTYISVMLFLARPLLKRFERRYSTREGLSQNAVAIVLLMLLLSSLTTELIGIHALFGAFFLGVAMPNETSLVRNLTEKIEDIAVLFLLPLFFASTGLKTHIGLLDSAEIWIWTGLILLVACLGKFGGSFVVSRITGLSWKESAAVGILMNTRGLMELIILNIGLDLGVISPLLFTMLVLMAVFTTFMTTPLLSWIYPDEEILAEAGETGVAVAEKPFTILVPVAFGRSGQGLMTIAAAIAGKEKPSRVYALHLIRTSERPSNYVKGQEFLVEASPLDSVVEKAKALGQEVRPLTFYSSDPAEEIVDVAKAKAADVILMGWHKPLLGGAVLGGTVRRVMDEAKSPVAVFIDRGLKKINRILVPVVDSPHDLAALNFAKRISVNHLSEMTLLHLLVPKKENAKASFDIEKDTSLLSEPDIKDRLSFRTLRHASPVDAVLEEADKGYDLVVIGVSEEFKLERRVFGLRSEKIAEKCPTSMLIIHQESKP